VVISAPIGAFDARLVLILIGRHLLLLLGVTPKGHLNVLIITLHEALHIPADVHEEAFNLNITSISHKWDEVKSWFIHIRRSCVKLWLMSI
jgi:hypothetical protein